MSAKKPVQEQGATLAAATNDTNQPSSRFNSFEPSLKEAAPTQTTGNSLKPFHDHPEHVEKCAQKGVDSPEDDIEDKGGTSLATSIPEEDLAASSALITGSSTQWRPEMGVEKFLFSHCREWRLRSDTELIVPKWSLSPALAPDTFQKYSLPFPHE